MRQFLVVAFLGGLALTACSETAAGPTVDINATIAAAVQATTEAGPNPVSTGNDPLPTGFGAGVVGTSISPLDDSKTVVASLAASQGQSTFGEPVVLILRCKGSGIDAFILWESYVTRTLPTFCRHTPRDTPGQNGLLSTNGSTSGILYGTLLDTVGRVKTSALESYSRRQTAFSP